MFSKKIKHKIKYFFVNKYNKTCYQYDPYLGFNGIPNLNIKFGETNSKNEIDRPINVKHNNHGNRQDQESTLQDEGIEAVQCYGGSHTWGGGVTQDSIYPTLLSELINIKVGNYGHCSFGLDQICLSILKNSDKKTKIIVVEQYCWALHRVLNTYVNGYIKPYFYLDSDKKLKLKKVPYIAKYKLVRIILGKYYSFKKEFREFTNGFNIKENYDPLRDPMFCIWKASKYDSMYALVDEILKVIKDHCRSNEIRLIFALGTILQQFSENKVSDLINYDLPHNRFIGLLNKHGIEYIDMREYMLSDQNKMKYIFTDGHINVAGHELFAEKIRDYIINEK